MKHTFILLSILTVMQLGCGQPTYPQLLEVESVIYGLDRNDPETKEDFQLSVKANIKYSDHSDKVSWIGDLNSDSINQTKLRSKNPNLPYQAYSRFVFGRNDGNSDILEITIMLHDKPIANYRTEFEFK